MLNDGYSDIPPGRIAFTVTALEMLARPPMQRASASAQRFVIRPIPQPDPDWYRDLFRRVGTDWLWFSRLKLDDAALAAILHDPEVWVYALEVAGHDEGLLELDFRVPDQCELAYFGVTAPLIGLGAGRQLMARAIKEAWQRPIRRFWVHTCTGDHPSALAFYMRSGFVPFRRQIEVADDPRLSGLLPETAAPHVPVIRGR